jgi:hypothetical protein
MYQENFARRSILFHLFHVAAWIYASLAKTDVFGAVSRADPAELLFPGTTLLVVSIAAMAVIRPRPVNWRYRPQPAVSGCPRNFR